MAVSNKNKFIKYAQQYNIGEYQLIMGNDKKGRNVKGMLVSGYMFDRLSQFGTDKDDTRIEDLMHDIACLGVKEAYKIHTSMQTSKAKQKASEAHGRGEGERFINLLEQSMTYADPFENIQFKGHTWVSVLNQLVNRELDSKTSRIEEWKESMKHWHDNSEQVCNSFINNGKIRVLGGHVIPEETFKRFLIQFCKENGFSVLSDTKMIEVINAYCNRYMAVIEGV